MPESESEGVAGLVAVSVPVAVAEADGILTPVSVAGWPEADSENLDVRVLAGWDRVLLCQERVVLLAGRPVTVERVVGRVDWGVVVENEDEAADVARTELDDSTAEPVAEVVSAASLVAVDDATLLAVVTVALTLTLADENVAEDAAEEEDAAGAEPSQVATDGPGAVYSFPPLSGWPVLP